jgi:uncharacterized protein YpmB
MNRKYLRWVLLLIAIFAMFLVILGGTIYKLKQSEAFALGVRAAASHLQLSSDAVQLAWWDNVTFAEGPTYGGAEFSVCGATACARVIVNKVAGAWSVSRVNGVVP